MPLRTFVRLLILLAVLIGAALWVNRRPDQGRIAGVASGDPVFAALDVNAVTEIQITGPDGSIHLRRAETGWMVEDLYGYPAAFPAIAGFLRKLNDLKVGQVVRGGETVLDEFSLNPEDPSSDFLAVTLSQAAGPDVSFALGALKRQRDSADLGMGRPPGRFMRVGPGPVLLVDELFSEVAPRALEWIERELLQVSPDEVASISVQTDRQSYHLRRDENGNYSLDDQAESETIQQSAAVQLFQGLQWLRFDTVVDPELADDEIGLAEVDIATFEITNGMAYALEMGRNNESSMSRPLRLRVTDVSPDQSRADEVERLNRRFDGWRYQMPAMVLGQLTPPRESLVTIAESETDASGNFEEVPLPARPEE